MMESLRPRLLVLRGGEAVASWEIPPEKEWRLGRSPDSPLPLEERSISRHHVRVFCGAEGVRLEDLGTPNGTWVDGRPVKGSIVLRDGNLIRLGQSTNPDPLLLRFEDPGGRLLDAMARSAPPPGAEPVEPAAGPEPAVASAEAPPPEATTAPPARAPREMTVVFDASGAARAEPGEDTTAPAPEAEPEPPPPRRPGIPKQAILWAGLAFVFVLWLLWGLRSTQKPWQSVRVDPLRAQSGGRVALRGTEIEPSQELKVFVETQEARIEELARGELVFTVPEIAAAEAGTRTVTLRVERRGIVLLRQTLQHETVPVVRAIEPEEAAVGDTVRLTGSGFASEPGRIEVRVGREKAALLDSSPQEIHFRVPVLTRSVVVEAPVEVVIGGVVSAPVNLRVRPREAPCFVLAFEPRYVAPRVWEIRHRFGPALYLEAPPPAEAADAPAPERVRQAIDGLGEAFGRAGSDPGVRFEVRGAGSASAIVALGLGPAPREVARWGRSVVAWVKEQAPELQQVELVPYWNAVVLNELLNVFAKKQAPRLLSASDPARAALARLNALSLETGGQGCPSASEVETLTTAEADAFERAALRVPPRFGDVGGTWQGTFENAFSDDPQKPTLELKLELRQSGTTLEGRAFIYELRGPGIRWSPPPLEGLRGRVKLGAETQIEMTFQPGPPYDLVHLSGTVSEDVLDGVFRNERGKQARFQLGFGPSQ